MAENEHKSEAKHEHGTMDISHQERTFSGFITLATYTAIGVILVLIFLALVNA